ncbi:MAG: efflux RND transporter periplasmic adaptor subunit [Firmicutes bacterium]|nr:efflux RND transporter periplasmic adaptor subunit [Bacillota bacterium]
MARIKELIGKGRIWKIGGLILLLAIGFGCYKYFYTNNQVTYLASMAQKGTITDAIECTGTLESVRSVGLSFKSVENVTVLNVKPGDRVEAGQVLAEQDTKELSAAVSQAQRAVTRQEASIKSLHMTSDKAYKTLQQQESLAEVGAASQTDIDNAQDDYEKAQLDITTANAQLQDSRASLETSRENLAATKITAPFAGIVSAVNGDVGQRSGGGSGSDVNAFITLISDELQIKALVNEVDMGRLEVGQEVEFTSTAYSGKTFTGRVVRISPTATTTSNVQFYQTLITVDDPDHLLYPGMSASVNIIVARKSDVVKTSMTALTYAESYQKSSPTAAAPGGAAASAAGRTTADSTSGSANKTLVVLEGGTPVLKPVVIGLNDGQDMEVVEGINPGDQVVIGTNQVSTSTSSTSTSSNTSNSRTQGQQGGGPGMGGPPPF